MSIRPEIHNKVRTAIRKELSSKWNSGLLHGLLGPVALIGVVCRGIMSFIQLFRQPKKSLIADRITFRNDKELSAIINEAIFSKIVNKLYLFLSSVVGSALWAGLAYLITSFIQVGTSAALFKLIAAVVIALGATPGFPFICLGFGVFFFAVVLVNKYFSSLPPSNQASEIFSPPWILRRLISPHSLDRILHFRMKDDDSSNIKLCINLPVIKISW